MRLATLLRLVAISCDMLGVVGSNLKNCQLFHATFVDVASVHDVEVVWPGSCNNVGPGHAH